MGIRAEGVRKIFPGGVVAVRDASFGVERGEFFVILGPSGSGKTTLMRIIAGLEKPDRGRIWLGDRLVSDPDRELHVPPRERNVGMVFQNWALYPHMRVFDNIAYPLKIKRTPRQEVEKRVKEVAETLGISDLLDRYPRQLSGGQQQRVALARALVKHPDILLLDEPFSNLDARIRIVAREFVKRLQRRLGITAVLVTHDQADAFAVADRIMIMNNGTIQQIGSPLEIYSTPSNLFVASFVGDPPMNILEAERIRHATLAPEKIPGGPGIYIGFRPEESRVEPLARTAGGQGLVLRGRLEMIEMRGSTVYATVSIDQDLLVKALMPPASQGIAPGSQCLVVAEKYHMFNSSGTRI